MNEIQGAQRRTYQGRKKPTKTPEYRPEDEGVIETSTRAKEPADEPVEASAIPSRISVKQTEQLRKTVPGNVWQCAPFKWEPVAFGLESERLNEKIIEANKQNESLSMFADDPTLPLIYGVSGNPDDRKAKLFAAYLLALHISKVKDARIEWATLYGGFDNHTMRKYDRENGDELRDPTIIVLSNLTPNASTVKLDKARDLIERFDKIPRIVVSCGEDPISFHATRLFAPLNAMAYFSERLIKARIEIL
jgi:hypothetical protein